MGLQPIAHNAQVQRLTTALKNICRDYPAGGTVLRELLQNADDAGATVVVRNCEPRTGLELIEIPAIHSRRKNSPDRPTHRS